MSLPVGKEWRKVHFDNAMRIDRVKRVAAVEFIRKELSSESVEEIRKLGNDDAEWWAAAHFGWGMAMRNALRKNGFGEKELAVDNLDDYYIGLVEMAVHLTEEAV